MPKGLLWTLGPVPFETCILDARVWSIIINVNSLIFFCFELSRILYLYTFYETFRIMFFFSKFTRTLDVEHPSVVLVYVKVASCFFLIVDFSILKYRTLKPYELNSHQYVGPGY